MSSVGSSDSSNNNRDQETKIRKNREAYNKNEAELVKKHQKEIRRLNEEHYKEVENLKKAQEAQMKDLRKQTNQDVSARDHKYNQDVEDMRDLYRKQLQSQADENVRQTDTLRKAITNDHDLERAHREQRFEKLNDDYQKGLQNRESTYESSLKENREQQTEAIHRNADRLARSYEEQAKALKDERNLRVGGLQKAYDEYRQNSEARFRDQELRHFQDEQRSSDNMLRAVQKERQAKTDSEEYLREGFKDGIEKTRERFEKKAQQERDANNVSREEMRSDVGSRIQNQVVRLEREREDLKDGNIRTELKLKQDKEREINNLKDSWQKNLDAYKDERDAAIEQSNYNNHRDIQKVRKELDDQATASNRFYRQLEAERNQVHKSAYDNLNRDFKIRNEETKSIADRRVKQLYESTSAEKARMAELQAENHTASQRAHQDDMKQLRVVLEDDKQQAVANLQEHLQRQEVQHSERMAQVVAKYEKQIQGLKDDLIKEKKSNDENLRRVTDEMQRQHKLAVDQLTQQNRDHMRVVDAQHADELRSVNKRNDQKVDQLMAEMKKT